MRVRDWIVVGLLMNGPPMATEFIGWSWDIRHEEKKVDNEEDCGHVIRVGNSGDIATMMMFVIISIKILKMQEVITWLIQQS